MEEQKTTESTSRVPGPAPGTAESAGQDGLRAGLKNRHLSMIAIGGIIGAGLFVGSGAGIAKAGPAIVLSYLIAGLLVVLVMRMLGEMAAADPSSGSFSTYADRALGRWAGFSIGWLYWWFWVVVLAVEATAAATILTGWVPAVPQWAWALIVMVLLTATNLASVGSYGEFEFWFAGIKVVAIVLFIAVAGLAVLGLLPGSGASPGTSNLTAHGGFLPHGPGAVLSGMLLVVFSFMGSEIVTLAAGESAHPAKMVRRATNSVIWRIGTFYLGSIALAVMLVPWNSKALLEKGPYVATLDRLGIAHAGTIMDVIVVTAVLSCLNSGLYTASRMAFSLGRRGDAPAAFAKVSSRGVPATAIWASVAFGFVAVIFNYTSPDTVFEFLLNSSGAVALFVWLVICFSQLRMRRVIERETPERHTVRMWLFPYLTYATIALMLFVIGYMFYDEEGRQQMVMSVVVAAVVVVLGVVLQRRGAGPGSATGSETGTRSESDTRSENGTGAETGTGTGSGSGSRSGTGS